jgi:hypothetical protein
MKHLLVFILCLLTIGCSDSGSVRTAATGMLGGIVYLLDHNGHPLPDHSGVLVEVENLPYTAVTDQNGEWKFSSFPGIDCTIRYSKEGFGSQTMEVIANFDNGTVYFSNTAILLTQEPTFTLTLDGIVPPQDSSTYGTIYFHTSGAVWDSAIVNEYIISGKTPQLTLEDTNTFTAYVCARGDQSLIQGSHDRNITAYVPIEYGIFGKPGDTIYIRAYPTFEGAAYFNPHTTDLPPVVIIISGRMCFHL